MQWWAWIAIGAVLLGFELAFIDAQFYLVFVGGAALLVGSLHLAGLDVAVWLAPGNDGGARGVLEAMAVGLPVVAYDRPPMSTQLADGAGVLVAPPELEGALLKLLRDPAERTAIGVRARERVLERYTAAARVPALIAFYEGVLRG